MFFKGKGLKPSHFNKKAKYIVDNFLVDGAINLIYAPPKTGKSSFAVSLLKYLLENTKYYNLYIDYDNPIVALEDRGVSKIIEKYSGFDYIHPDVVCMGADEVMKTLIKDLDETDYKDTIIFFDSVADFVDVMSDSAVSGFMNNIKLLRNAGATVVLLHHTNKNEGTYKGSSVFRSACDNMFFLNSKKIDRDKAYILLKSTSSRFGKIRNKAYLVDYSSWTMKEEDYEKVSIPLSHQDFIKKVVSVLKNNKEIKQGELLEMIGKDKADKTSLELLSAYNDKYWIYKMEGKSKIYTTITTSTT